MHSYFRIILQHTEWNYNVKEIYIYIIYGIRIKCFTVYLVSMDLFVDKITCYKRRTPCLCITSPIKAYLRKIWVLPWPVMLSTCKAWGTLRSFKDSTCFRWNYKPDQEQANMWAVTVAPKRTLNMKWETKLFWPEIPDLEKSERLNFWCHSLTWNDNPAQW